MDSLNSSFVEFSLTEVGNASCQVSPFSLQALKIEITCSGFISETSFLMTWKNESDVQLEGELQFPLGPSMILVGHAIDINGQMVDAVIVEKQEARTVYETEVREKKTGPSLTENVVGNMFKTKIFPFLPKGNRIVQLVISSPLENAAKYFLSLQSKHSVAQSVQVLVNIKVNTFEESIKHSKSLFPLLCFSQTIPFIQKTSTHFMASYQASPFNFPQSIEFSVCPQNCMVERDLEHNSYFFSIFDIISFQTISPPPKLVNETINIGIFWDCSLSRKETNFKKELDFLFQLLQKFSNVYVDIYSFSIRTTFESSFKVSNESFDAISQLINNLEYNGGTDLYSIDFPANKSSNEAYNCHLVFSDGLSVFGKPSNSKKLSKIPVHVVTSNQIADHILLKTIAISSGGTFFDLRTSSIPMMVENCFQSIVNATFSFISCDYDPRILTEVYPSSPQPIQSNNCFVCGKFLSNKSTTITINYGFGKIISRKKKIQLIPDGPNSQIISRQWAIVKINELSLFPDLVPNSKELIISISKEFNISTSSTSFLVLENLEAFVKHKILPPRSLPELRKKYLKLISSEEETKRNDSIEKLQRTLNLWERRISWWETQFTDGRWQPQINHSKDTTEIDELEVEFASITFKPPEIQPQPILKKEEPARIPTVTHIESPDFFDLLSERRAITDEPKTPIKESLSVSSTVSDKRLLVSKRRSLHVNNKEMIQLKDSTSQFEDKSHSSMTEQEREYQEILRRQEMERKEVEERTKREIEESMKQQIEMEKRELERKKAEEENLRKMEEERRKALEELQKQKEKLYKEVETNRLREQEERKRREEHELKEIQERQLKEQLEMQQREERRRREAEESNKRQLEEMNKATHTLHSTKKSMDEQDQKLEELHMTISRLQNISADISNEIEDHLELLSDSELSDDSQAEVIPPINTNYESKQEMKVKDLFSEEVGGLFGELECDDLLTTSLKIASSEPIPPQSQAPISSIQTPSPFKQQAFSQPQQSVQIPSPKSISFPQRQSIPQSPSLPKPSSILQPPSILQSSSIPRSGSQFQPPSPLSIPKPSFSKPQQSVQIPSSDKIQALKKDIDDVKYAMLTNCSKLVERSENIEILQSKSEELSNSSLKFRKQSKTLSAGFGFSTGIKSFVSGVVDVVSDLKPGMNFSLSPAVRGKKALAIPIEESSEFDRLLPPQTSSKDGRATYLGDGSFSESYMATIGADFSTANVSIGGKDKKLFFWDTAGQERFRSITSSYYRGATGVILVYDLSNRQSFLNLNTWVSTIFENKIRVVLLVGNKSDLPAQVSYEEGKTFAEKHNFLFYQVSAKNLSNLSEALLAFTNAQAELADNFKVCFMGDSGVGKSSLCRRFSKFQLELEAKEIQKQPSVQKQSYVEEKSNPWYNVSYIFLILGVVFMNSYNIFGLMFFLVFLVVYLRSLETKVVEEPVESIQGLTKRVMQTTSVNNNNENSSSSNIPQNPVSNNNILPSSLLNEGIEELKNPEEFFVDQYDPPNYSEEEEKEHQKKEDEACDRYFGVLSKMKVLQLDCITPIYIQLSSKDHTPTIVISPEISDFIANHSASPTLQYIQSAAQYFLNNEKKGFQILTNILESHLGESQFYRIVGYKLMELNSIQESILVFEKILELRGEEPQSYRDLALALCKRKTRSDFNRAVQLLMKVIQNSWDVRFDQIELTCLMDLKLLLNRANLLGIPITQTIPLEMNHHFHQSMDVDIRIIVSWDTDLTDVELIVYEPNNEICSCFHNQTQNGGYLSRNFTGGYGPNEYLIKQAPFGEFKVFIKLRTPNKIIWDAAGVSVFVSIFSNAGRLKEVQESKLVHLYLANQPLQVATIQVRNKMKN